MATFELHVWGPAFGLPSIDAECIAAIAYLHYAIPSSEWVLVPSSDPSVTPHNRLPALQSRYSRASPPSWTSGYNAIASYLSSETSYGLDDGLTPSQLAAQTTYSAYIYTRLGPLLDVSLYALPRNWTDVVRPAYSDILPFPLTWTVPTEIRKAAKSRVDHLLAGLSLNDDEDENAEGKDIGPLDAALKHIPTTRRKGVFEELAPGQAATIRMHAMAADALSVLEELRAEGERELGTKHRLLSDEDGRVSSLDCLAFGYLSLMRAAPVPQDFLRKVLCGKFPSLVVMIDDLSVACLDKPGALPMAEPDGALAPYKSVSRILGRFLDGVVRVTPVVGEGYVIEGRRRAELGSTGLLSQRTLALTSSFLAMGSVLAYGGWWYHNLPMFGLRTQTWMAARAGKLGGYGEMGAMLDYMLGGPPRG